ncbi:hypothetical protein [Streptomyces sp. NPDC090026]|uniref:hypothetical protein n=1 Tax=Streptomyces sp. NPDC090026 TaxID=3365923 RepID=UPI00382B4894
MSNADIIREADTSARLRALQAAARLAVSHLHTAAYRLRDHGDPEADELLATADALADDIA